MSTSRRRWTAGSARSKINKDDGEEKKICGNIITKGAEKEGDKGRNNY